ncbi:MAG: cytochrome c family protein [Calditrichia bacterium]
MRMFLFLLFIPALLLGQMVASDSKGKIPYDQFEQAETCGSCHTDFYQQWTQAMMSQAYTHEWDEIEYFKLAENHARVNPELRDVIDGCNGCHTPMAFLAGDLPPKPPKANTRANESVTCDVCHTISGFQGDTPFNFNYILQPGDTKIGPKDNIDSPYHQYQYSKFISTAEYCGTCHNEKDPHGVWVKSTQLEWKEGPYGKDNIPCQTCHMPKAIGKSASMSDEALVAQHLFHGAHDEGKLKGAIEIRVHPEEREWEIDDLVTLKVQLFNGKCGHKVPSGSVEDRIMWLEVKVIDKKGNSWMLPVVPKGFEGEQYTIGSDELAYQDMGIPLEIKDFKGVRRDGIVPVGARIFRMPYFDPEGRMTIMQWNTKSLGVDYRIGPRETKIETYQWEIPDDAEPGTYKVRVTLKYQRLVQSVAEFLEVPKEEYDIVEINHAETWFNIIE